MHQNYDPGNTTSGFERLPSGALNNYQLLEKEIPIEKEGFLYIFVANESPYDQGVWFDDFKVEVTKSKVTAVSDYYPFGMLQAGNSTNSGDPTGNKYLFQGKEIQNELGLDTYDFEWRMYDPAIARTFQMDPHAESYYSISPYSFLGNNPLLFVDPNGMDNIIYLILAGDFDKKQAQAIIDQANAAFKDLGLETRVSLHDSKENGAFDASNLDETDNWSIIGNDRNAIIETAKGINPEWANYLEDGTKPWSKGDNPETSNNARHGDGRGILIDHKNNLNEGAKNLTKEQGSGLVIAHGAGHSAKRIINHQSSNGEYGHTDTGIMQEGNGLVRDLNRHGKSTVLDKSNNPTYIQAMKERYGTNKATDNYSRNKQKK